MLLKLGVVYLLPCLAPSPHSSLCRLSHRSPLPATGVHLRGLAPNTDKNIHGASSPPLVLSPSPPESHLLGADGTPPWQQAHEPLTAQR
ncbi:hypothetical protein EV126DRAFT_426165 [Verticillium dahliae]|nr:hypothetical protein EV126DRAFT_426165 [Verticillium dahliae]